MASTARRLGKHGSSIQTAVRALEQHARDQVDRLHRAVEDHDLPGLAIDAARRREVSRRRLAQGSVAERREIAEQPAAADATAPRRQPPPQRQRKRVERRHSRQERLRPRHAGRRIANSWRCGPTPRRPRAPCGRARWDAAALPARAAPCAPAPPRTCRRRRGARETPPPEAARWRRRRCCARCASPPPAAAPKAAARLRPGGRRRSRRDRSCRSGRAGSSLPRPVRSAAGTSRRADRLGIVTSHGFGMRRRVAPMRAIMAHTLLILALVIRPLGPHIRPRRPTAGHAHQGIPCPCAE